MKQNWFGDRPAVVCLSSTQSARSALCRPAVPAASGNLGLSLSVCLSVSVSVSVSASVRLSLSQLLPLSVCLSLSQSLPGEFSVFLYQSVSVCLSLSLQCFCLTPRPPVSECPPPPPSSLTVASVSLRSRSVSRQSLPAKAGLNRRGTCSTSLVWPLLETLIMGEIVSSPSLLFYFLCCCSVFEEYIYMISFIMSHLVDIYIYIY